MNLILADARLIDGAGGKQENAAVIIEGENIREVISGGKVPEMPGFTRIDCRGKTVTPGLIDTHVHVSGGDVVPGIDDYRVSRRMDEHLAMHAYRTLEAAQRALRAGFTTLRDMSSRDFVDVQLRIAVSEGLVVAPRILCSGIGITMTGGHVWRKCIQVDGPDEVRKEVRRQVREGVDWIKVMGVTGGVASPGQDIRKTQFTHEEISAAVEETHRLGRLCGAHVHGAAGIASCVEAEAKRDEERPVIAGVLANRLRKGMRLECDATVQYALGAGRKARLFNKDLLVDSEYNTYLHAGLPPGPICSPGAASIRAAMNPASVPYFFYVARPDGSHIFSRTFAEHQAAIARLRQGK